MSHGPETAGDCPPGPPEGAHHQARGSSQTAWTGQGRVDDAVQCMRLSLSPLWPAPSSLRATPTMESGCSVLPEERPSRQFPQPWASHSGIWQGPPFPFSPERLDSEPLILTEQPGRGKVPLPPCPSRGVGWAPFLASQGRPLKVLDIAPPRTLSSAPRSGPGPFPGADCCCGRGTGRANESCPNAGCEALAWRSSAPGCAPRTCPLSDSPARSATRAAGFAASSWPPPALEGRGKRRSPPAARPLSGDPPISGFPRCRCHRCSACAGHSASPRGSRAPRATATRWRGRGRRSLSRG